jgi:hypothetical protein
MANLGRTISGVNNLSSFTAKVVYAASGRYGTTQANVTFQTGYEYQGANFFKGLNRAPKVRILSIFQPLINGSPNANNDTYVAFQIYDYTLNVWRGPWCKRNLVNDPWTYVDYFVTTIDSFGRKYGNYYTGTGSTSSTGGFSVPQLTYSVSASLYLRSLGMSVTTQGGHYPGAFTLAGSNNQTFHFHGFMTLSGLTGTWCFYSIAVNGTAKDFNHLLDAAPYNSGTYPNVLPYTNKLSSEWRYATFCNLDTLGYSPRVNIRNTGPIKYYPGPTPTEAFPSNIGIVEGVVWATYDPEDAANFFLTPLWSPGATDTESALGIEGTNAANYAPAGWYGTSIENSYAYWDGNGNWSPNTYATYVNSTKFQYYGFYETQNPLQVCQMGPTGLPNNGFYDGNEGFGTGLQLYSDSNLTQPIGGAPGRWYYNSSDAIVYQIDMTGRVSQTFKC